jgi:hypothetical protein
MTKFSKWLDTFMTEKNLPIRTYEIEWNGQAHFVESDFVVELAKQSSDSEKSFIKQTIVKIDFMNGDVHHFLEHLANAYVRANF